MDRARVTPHLACLRPTSYLDRLAPDLPVTVLDVPVFRGTRIVGGVRRAREWTRRAKLDVVLTFFRDANIVATLGARWAGVPVVSGRRNLGYWHTPREVRLLRLLNRFTQAFVANSEAVRNETARREGVSPERIRVIPNAVDTERFRPAAPGERQALRLKLGFPPTVPLVGCVANLRPVKGHEVLLDAFAAVCAHVPEARLALIGEGPAEPSLHERAGALGILDRLHFLGLRDDVPELLRTFDVAVSASYSEGLSNALLEAMASGLPTVATAVGGNTELLEDGLLGTLVPPSDPAAMAVALRNLLTSPDRCRRLGAAARDRVRSRNSPESVIEAWHRVIESTARPH
jgi:glycosyltransferase involved in cell wall biosynthesis